MATRKVYIGIDFGTSNSSVAFVISDPREKSLQRISVESVEVAVDDGGFAKSDRLPTVLAAPLDSRRRSGIFGWGFFQQFFGRRKRAELLRHGENFFGSVKSDLGTMRVYPHAFSSDYNTPEKVAAAIIRQLMEEARRKLPGYDVYKAQVVISVPASLNSLGREQTLAAAVHAGLDPERIELVDEPVAALLHFLNSNRAAGVLDYKTARNILVFDYGGGTLDLALVRARFDSSSRAMGLRVLNLAISQYRRLGGDDVDRAIMDQVVWPQIEEALGVSGRSMAGDLRKRINDTLIPTVVRRLKEGICRRIAEARSGGRSRRTVDFVERLDVSFKGVDLPRRFQITAKEFERVMEPFLSSPDASSEPDPRSLLRPILEVLDRGGITGAQLDAIILHGGSCRNPLVRDLLSTHVGRRGSLFPGAVVEETPNLDTSVACGAALASYWRYERKTDIVAPIIAEEIGIVTLDGKRVRLVEAGEDLPFPGADEVHVVDADFHVPRGGLDQMLVPFYTGDQTKRITSSVLVNLPRCTESGTPVSIKLRIDRNKALHWWCRVGDGVYAAAESIDDPWSSELPTRHMQALHEHRREMREMLERGDEIDADVMAMELNLLFKAGLLDEADVLARDIIRHFGLTSVVANLLGVIAHQQHRLPDALSWAKKASELEPDDPVLVGNLGCMLCALGRTSEAEAKIRAALAINPQHGYLNQWLGDMYRSQGLENRARTEFTEALRLALEQLEGDGGHEAWTTVADLHHRLGHYQKSIEAKARAAEFMDRERLGGDPKAVIAASSAGEFRTGETP